MATIQFKNNVIANPLIPYRYRIILNFPVSPITNYKHQGAHMSIAPAQSNTYLRMRTKHQLGIPALQV